MEDSIKQLTEEIKENIKLVEELTSKLKLSEHQIGIYFPLA